MIENISRMETETKVFVQFRALDEDNQHPNTDVQISVPLHTSTPQLEALLNKLLENVPQKRNN